jgi:hypothetical protein
MSSARNQREIRYVPPKRRLTLSELHGVLSQKILLFNIFLGSSGEFWDSKLKMDHDLFSQHFFHFTAYGFPLVLKGKVPMLN